MVARTLASALLAGSALGAAVHGSYDRRDAGYVLVGFDDVKGQARVNYSAIGANHHYLDYSNFLLGTKGNNIPPRTGMFKLTPETAPNVAAFGQAGLDSQVASSLTAVISVTPTTPAPIAAFEIVSFGAGCYRGHLKNLTAPSKHLRPDNCNFGMTFVPLSGGAPVSHNFTARGTAANEWAQITVGSRYLMPLKQVTFSAPANRTIVIDNLLVKLIKPAKSATSSTPSATTPSASAGGSVSGGASASTPAGGAGASGGASGSASASPSG